MSEKLLATNLVMTWAFAGLTTCAALAAALLRDFRRVVLALWVAGLGVGAFYLTLGSEFLAIVQWIVSTLVAIAFLFYSVLFGEEIPRTSGPVVKAYPWILAVLLGTCFMGIVAVGGSTIEIPALPERAGGLASLGRVLTDQHLLSLEVIALTLFVVLIGGGVVARPEADTTEIEHDPSRKADK